MNVDVQDADRNLLFGMLALQRGSIDSDTLVLALKDWVQDKQKPIDQILARRKVVGQDELTRVKASFDQHLKAHGNDPARSLAAVGVESPLPAGVGQIIDRELQAAITHVASTCPPAHRHEPEPTMATEAGLPESPHIEPDAGDLLEQTMAFAAGPPTLPVQARSGSVASGLERQEPGGATPTLPEAPGPGGSVNDTLDVPARAANALRTLSFIADLDATQAPTNKLPGRPGGPQAGDAELSASLEAGKGPVLPSRYRILRSHARGGLGEVYVAFDEELRREVALKEIQLRHANRTDSRLRFLLEAEVTGGLEHPGIVPVYGLGRYADGRPYYAMRFIRGQSLQDAVDHFHLADLNQVNRDPGERSLEFRQLLERFRDVCNAIGYAHSRGVIHRDIKPANVMLGAFGETLVVDWGLAKALDRAEVEPITGIEPLKPLSASGKSETLYGSALGTPQFMSPEQAAGQLEVLGPASDVYSLGATLYYLLSGKAAFREINPASLLNNVQRGKFPKPREVNRRVEPALEAICLKAMATKPEDRYSTALLLSADLEHWLADEPVSVYREPLVERMARWAKRHKRLVTAAAAVLITGITALGIGTVMVKREQARTEANFRLARDAVDQMLTELGEVELADVPQMEPVRKKMLAKALKFYQSFLKEHGDDRSIRQETGRANIRLGDILEMLGDYDGAEHAYERAVKLLTALIGQDPQRPSYRRDLARAQHNLGVLQKKSLRFEEAEKNLNAARRIRKQLVADFPQSPDDQHDANDTVYQLGTLWARLSGKHKDAEAAYREAVQAETDLTTTHPGETDYQRRLARYRNNRGILLKGSSLSAAETEIRDALKIQDPLADQSPSVAGLQWERARSTSNLGTVLEGEKNLPDAEAAYRKALDGFKKLADGFPSVPDYQHEMAGVYANLGSLLEKTGRSQEGEVNLRQAVAIYAKLAERYPHRPDYPQKLAEAERKLAILLKNDNRLSDAEAVFRDARSRLEALVAANPLVPEYQNSLGEALLNLARAYYAESKREDVRACLEEAIKHNQAALAVSPDNTTYRQNLLNNYEYMREYLITLHDHQRALKAADELVRILPGDPSAEIRAVRFLALASGLVAQETEMPATERSDRAKAYADRAVEMLRQAVRHGFLKPKELEAPFYEPIRTRADFQAIQKQLEAKITPAVG
ncbi:MAG TPA: serine/threonine-protein kinase [Isosphaeraceae bacterium]|jgi:serine/threonine-protein kinase|nr:serine/threonine-protein kinase [Isosphaeraceae bacterium]